MNNVENVNINELTPVKFELKRCSKKLNLSDKTKIKLSDVGTLSELVKMGIETSGSIASKGGNWFILCQYIWREIVF